MLAGGGTVMPTVNPKKRMNWSSRVCHCVSSGRGTRFWVTHVDGIGRGALRDVGRVPHVATAAKRNTPWVLSVSVLCSDPCKAPVISDSTVLDLFQKSWLVPFARGPRVMAYG